MTSRTGQKQETKLFVAQHGPFGTPFLTPKIPPQQVYVGPFLRSFPGNEAHKHFSGGPKWGILGGGQKVYVENIYVLCPSLTLYDLK